MSKLYYDHLVDLSEVEKALKKNVKDKQAREELYLLIDEIVHHRITGCILDRLPENHHEEFVSQLHKHPHDESILEFLREKLVEDVEAFIKEEVQLLSAEFLDMIHQTPKNKTKKTSTLH